MDALGREVFDLIKGLDRESANIVAGMIISEGVHYDLGDYNLAKAYMEHCQSNAAELKNHIIRSYISKRAAGEDVESLVALATNIAKAETADQRRKALKGQARNHGRFGFRPGKVGNAGKPRLKREKDERTAGEKTLDTMDAIAQAHRQSYTDMYAGGTRADNMAFVPGVRNARRVGQSANFVQSTVGGYLGTPTQVGLGATSLVSSYASDAQRAFGPAVDRAKYRYKGVERKLDDGLKEAVAADRSREGQNFNVAGTHAITTLELRRRQARGSTGGAIGYTSKDDVAPSATVAYFQRHLPDQRFARLQRAAGHQPPSEGIIIDKDGKVGAQMVGKGDDWYLPFNLGNLGALKGGQYVRTRSNGGLTTEDVYTGLMSGADRMTVVSHNGTYTMQFDPTLRGSRRYSQTAREMTARYGQLLDAVKNGNVRVNRVQDVDRGQYLSMLAESEGNRDVYNELESNFYAKPIPSQTKQNEWDREFIDSYAAKQADLDGNDMTPSEFEEKRVLPMITNQLVEETDPFIPGTTERLYSEKQIRDDATARAGAMLATNPQSVIARMGMSRDYGNVQDDYKNFNSEKLNEYREELKPVSLNGQGYDYAAKALKEQFPYFIKDEGWEPNQRGGQDHGYVKPRYNRAEALQEGYYDDSILGYGKVTADRTRYQNAGVSPTVETGHVSGLRGFARAQAEPAAGQTSTDTAGQSGGSSTPAAPTQQRAAEPPLSASAQRRKSDMALFNKIATAQKFSDDWKLEGALGDAQQQTMKKAGFQGHRGLEWMKTGIPKYRPLTMTQDQLDAMSDDDLHAAAVRAATVIADTNIIDVDPDLLNKVKAGGRLNAQDVDWQRFDPDADDSDIYWTDNHEPGKPKSVYSDLFYAPRLKRVRDEAETPNINSTEDNEENYNYLLDTLGQELGSAKADGADVQANDLARRMNQTAELRRLNRLFGGGGNGPQPIRAGQDDDDELEDVPF